VNWVVVWVSVSDRVTRQDSAEKSVLLHTVKFNKDKGLYPGPLNLSFTTYGSLMVWLENGAWLWRMTSLTTQNKVDVAKMRSKKERFHGFNYLKMLSASLMTTGDEAGRSFWGPYRIVVQIYYQVASILSGGRRGAPRARRKAGSNDSSTTELHRQPGRRRSIE
jgi:hypothetical protein